MKRPRNHYDNLKVDRKASADEIKKAYRRLSSQHHPDKNGGSQESIRIMQCVNAAYEALSDPARRAVHDAWIARVEPPVRQGPTAAQQEAMSKVWEKKSPTEPKTYAKAKADIRAKSKRYSTDDIFKEFMKPTFRHGGTKYEFKPPKPKLRPEHRPEDFDEAHLKGFLRYNDAMRGKLFGPYLEQATPELIYRAFILDNRRCREAPRTFGEAYKALKRAMNEPEDKPASRAAGFLESSPFLKGVLATIVLISLAIAYYQALS